MFLTSFKKPDGSPIGLLATAETGPTPTEVDKCSAVDALAILRHLLEAVGGQFEKSGPTEMMLRQAAGYVRAAAVLERPKPPRDPSKICSGHGGDATGPKCCDRAGDLYNGFGSDGPTIFTCPKSCSCHD